MKFSGERAVYFQNDLFSDALFVRKLFRAFSFEQIATSAAGNSLVHRLEHGAFDRLVISNPYRDAVARSIYEKAREKGLPLLIIERGALPRSIFLDTSGFLGDSRNYDRIHWDHPLPDAAKARLNSYRNGFSASVEALERQAAQTGAAANRRRLLNGRRFLCAVTMQMSTDAATNHFCRPGLDYGRFKALIGEAVSRGTGDWEIVVKPHPREPMHEIGGKATAENINIDDLIDAADALVTFNSGTGVLAMLRDKPVGCFGDAFYGGEGLTATLNSVEDMMRFLRSAAEHGHHSETRDRFLYHLIFRLYSEVKFLRPLPFLPMSRPVAMQGRIIRVFDAASSQSFELDRTRSGISLLVDREAERLRAWYRALGNRIALLSGPDSGRTKLPRLDADGSSL